MTTDILEINTFECTIALLDEFHAESKWMPIIIFLKSDNLFVKSIIN